MHQRTILRGLQISRNIPYRDPNATFSLIGTDGNGKNSYLPVGEELLSQHMLLLGAPATGKSNMLYHLLRNLRANLAQDDLLLVFDPTGEYVDSFRQTDDLVVGAAKDDAQHWNLFEELNEDDRVAEDASSLCDTLFGQRIRQSPDPYVMTAARDLFFALIVYLRRQEDASLRNHQALRELIDGFDTESMLAILDSQPELRALRPCIADEDDPRTLAIVSALQKAARELLQGGLRLEGTFSIRQLMADKGGKVVFLRYDTAHGAGDGAMFSAMLDLALQRLLQRDFGEGRLYLLLDQPDVLPKLPHLPDALALGRDRGLRLMLALRESGGFAQEYGPVALSAFGVTVAFRMRDRETRDYVKRLYGRHRIVESYTSAVGSRGLNEEALDTFVIEDEALTALETGESILSTQHYPPFYFRMKQWNL